MKTQKTKILARIMTKVRIRKGSSFIGLSILALLLTVGAVGEAQARIRVRATVHTPLVQVRIDNGFHQSARNHRRALPLRYDHDIRITQRDRKIARRLGHLTGRSGRELIQLRQQGYSWNEIGRWLGVPGRVVQAAKNGGTWQRFLAGQRRGPFCQVGGR
jgi:hypothetical protein